MITKEEAAHLKVGDTVYLAGVYPGHPGPITEGKVEEIQENQLIARAVGDHVASFVTWKGAPSGICWFATLEQALDYLVAA